MSYIYRNVHGWLQPEVQYVYDLRMPAPPTHLDPRSSARARKDESAADAESSSEIPVNEKGEPNVLLPNDGEAEQFTLMSTNDIVKHILDDSFKPNCALVLIDFFIR